MKANLKISRAKTNLALTDPFYGSTALELSTIHTDRIPTMATDGYNLLYNDKWVDTITEEQVKGVIAHEVEHVLKLHHLRQGDRDHEKWNHACDYNINPRLTEAGYYLPPGGLYDDKYINKSAEEIYAVLPDPPKGGNAGNWGLVMCPKGNGPDGEPTPAEMEQMTMDAEQKLVRAIENAEGIGSIPGWAKEQINKIRKPKVDWRSVLRSTIISIGQEDFSYNRPNRKHFADDLYLPSMVGSRAGKWVWANDTSGSMYHEVFEFALGEIKALREEIKPEQLVIIDADTEVTDEKIFEDHDDISGLEITGRGGTAVTPAFDHVNKKHKDAQLMIYFTDLEVCDIPEKEPPYPVIWLCPSDVDTVPWGKLIHVKGE